VDRRRDSVLVRAQPARQKSRDVNDCAREIRRIIAAQGPIGVAEYMRIALGDPHSGYYVRRNPISGDFITSPEVSQIFGELIGLFFIDCWEQRGKPQRFRLIEPGPGRGTLMADMLRAARIRPEFLETASIDLVEISPVLRDLQMRALAGYKAAWYPEFGLVPADAPSFIIANEFFDALPVRQYVRRGDRWHERKIAIDGELFCFTADSKAAPDQLIPARLHNAPEGAVFEFSDEALSLAQEIASRVLETGGVALIIDYGHDRSGLADTFQAVKQHAYADPLAQPGEADLTCHVDFAALAHAARSRGAMVHGPVSQRQFLTGLGIRERADRLKRATANAARMIDSGVERLVGETQMGSLFKVIGFSPPVAAPLPGFSSC
jgi:NADH dehydrogenase [ubiquinone] 1 alpha subcomplex assembly factor 7